MSLETEIYEFLRLGDDCTIEPEDWPEPLKAELGDKEWKWLAANIARFLKKYYVVRRKCKDSGE